MYRYLALIVEQESMIVVHRYNLFPQVIPSSLATEVDHSLRTIQFEGEVADDFQEACDQFRIKVCPPRWSLEFLHKSPDTNVSFQLLSLKSYWMHRVEKLVSYKRSSYLGSVFGNQQYAEILRSAVLKDCTDLSSLQSRTVEIFKKRYQLKADHEVVDLFKLKEAETTNVIVLTEELLTEALCRLRACETPNEVREVGKQISVTYRLSF